MNNIIYIGDIGFGLSSLEYLKKDLFKTTRLIILSQTQSTLHKCESLSFVDETIQIPPFPKSRVKFKKNALRYINEISKILSKTKPKKVFFQQLYDRKSNLIATYIAENHPDIKICLIGDGFANAIDRPLYKMERVKQLYKAALYPLIGIKYTAFNDFWSGILAKQPNGHDLVHNIYLPEHFLCPYPEKKVKRFTMQEKNNLTKSTSAIFIGQNLLHRNRISKANVIKNTNTIINHLKENNITEFHYKPHPRSDVWDFQHPELLEAVIPDTELTESHILKSNYRYVISNYSTVLLLNAADTRKEYVSIGLDNIKVRRVDMQKVRQTLREFGVTIFP